ncbi:MAG TPA: urease accessory protein UreE [Polyangiaceae bacterium]|nr:urease accessory protein UreE [Polyangiaceae bacterium]
MLMLETLLSPHDPRPAADSLTLAFELRRRARLRARLDGGREVGLMLDRGLSLKHGDRLATRDGELVVEIRAQRELLSTVATDDPHLLTRAAYHLGNRHMPLQIAPGKLAYQHDHVLDHLMAELGLEVQVVEAPFEPEPGGYSGGHRHGEEGAEGSRGRGVEGEHEQHHHHHHHDHE